MGDGKLSIIEKSYKLLFVIYAPIALLSYIINAVGGFKISFMGIFLICVSGLSIILAIFLIARYTMIRKQIIEMPDINKSAPFLFRHDFLIPYIFISITSFTMLSGLIYSGVIKELTSQKEVISVYSKTKIALLLGLSDINSIGNRFNVENIYYDYGSSEMQALSIYRRNAPGHGNSYNFELVDHQMKYSKELEEKIVTLMKEGTIYFICTTSSVTVPLSKKFEQLISKSETKNKPILICTNSSSPKVETKANVVYRFFIRSSEQTKVLAKKSASLNLKTINYIAINNEYGIGSIDAFNKSWTDKGNLSISGIYLDPMLSEQKIIDKIRNSSLLSNKPDAIYIASYSQGLKSIIKALDEFPDDIVILATSGLSVKTNQKAVETTLNQKKWFMNIPKTKAEDEIFNYNIYTSFLYMSINKLIHVIESRDENPALSFHDEWTKTDIPKLLEFEYDKQGDFIVHTHLDSTFSD